MNDDLASLYAYNRWADLRVLDLGNGDSHQAALQVDDRTAAGKVILTGHAMRTINRRKPIVRWRRGDVTRASS